MPVDSNLLSDNEAAVTDTVANDSPPDDTTAIDTGTVDVGTDTNVAGDNAAVTDDTAASQPDPDAWRKSYEELGFQNLQSPEQAHARMVEAFRQRDEQLRDAQERLRYMQSMHSRIDSLSGHSPQASAEIPKPAEPSDLLSELSSGWVEPDRELVSQYVVTGEDGSPAWRSDTPAELRNQVEQYKLKQAAYHKVLADPRKLDEAINQRVERLLSTRLDGVLSERDTKSADRQAEEHFFAENNWVFERDPISGGVAIDPLSGHPVLSRDGKQFTAALQRVRESGVGRLGDQLQFALAIHRSQQTQTRQAPAQQRAAAQPTIEQQRTAMLGRTNRTPAKPLTAAGLTDGPGASRTGARRESWGASLVSDLLEERVTN